MKIKIVTSSFEQPVFLMYGSHVFCTTIDLISNAYKRSRLISSLKASASTKTGSLWDSLRINTLQKNKKITKQNWKYSINVWPFCLFCTCAGFACYGLCIRVQSWLGKVHMVTLHTIWTILVLMLCLTMEGCCALFENGVFNLKLFEFFVDIFNNWIIFRQKHFHFRLQCRPSIGIGDSLF